MRFAQTNVTDHHHIGTRCDEIETKQVLDLRRYVKPAVLIVDELGYLPIDKHGADLLFQIISGRYERAPTVINTNRTYKHWAQIFNNDSTLTSAILDRIMHHVDTIIIEGKSFRMKDEVEE